MALLPLFSRRKRQAEQPASDVFEYDELPSKVRVQILMNIDECIGTVEDHRNSAEEIYKTIVKELREELGRGNLTGRRTHSFAQELHEWFGNMASLPEAFDAVELFAMLVRHVTRGRSQATEVFESHIARINARLLEAGIGYEISGVEVLKKSNEFLHSEVVRPALHVLSESRFSSANEEFREAHKAFRAAEYEDCLIDCLKAFESVMKVIAADKGWALPANATASKLVAALFENEFVPAYMKSQFDGLRALLESSVPTTRNRSGGHGKGTENRSVPASLAAFQLHQTAAIIVFLGELEK
ncbi:hypothetical protein P7228_11320 [Altererythrobacter arenosus]|uniref:Abortive infection protein-like C-terminal domain-containing protein n=1 Tax=Altererythrobacter arenosus TaxID=3032592 RepID=A0ABY8FNI5_9SPHN|nr:hypothetical protein [Altererythrobacter sp. CAU 1644]WFL76584.1 hypothetical protein P7228_11320 [Altererythrobacter sp. CAU 1644]